MSANLSEKYACLVERLYQANLRMGRCRTAQERAQARWWLAGWNAALRREHDRRVQNSKTTGNK